LSDCKFHIVAFRPSSFCIHTITSIHNVKKIRIVVPGLAGKSVRVW
jgi:hypothetical protein